MPILALVAAFCAGCVEREIIITSEPFNAVVYDERGLPLSGTPADKSFTYYGRYRFTLVKDGYETLVVEENIQSPWYQWIGIDFITENLVPWTIRDIHRYHYKLKLLEVVPLDQVLQQAIPLRARGLTIGEPLPPSQPIPPRAEPAVAPQPPGILSNPGQPLLPPPFGQPAQQR